MRLWTISAEKGTGAADIAAALAAEADLPLVDRDALVGISKLLDPRVDGLEDVEERLAGRMSNVALSLALTAGAAEAYRELELHRKLPELARSVLREAARRPGVIVSPGAFAVLHEHPSAVHVRLWAPLPWRVERYARDHLLNHRLAERVLRHDDHLTRAWAKTLYREDLDDPHSFGIVLDASRFSTERLVETLLAAGCANARTHAA